MEIDLAGSLFEAIFIRSGRSLYQQLDFQCCVAVPWYHMLRV